MTTIDGHQCHVSRLAGMGPGEVLPGTTVDCPCGKRWRVTQSYGPAGRICGWELLEPVAEPDLEVTS